MKNVIVSAITAALVGACFYAIPAAFASRNNSGTMSNLNGPYATHSTISSTLVNARLADIESEITSSLDRSGRGGMLAALRGIDGTQAAPAVSFTSETGTGIYRIGSNDLGLSIGGTKIVEWTANGVQIPTTAPLFFNRQGSFPTIGFNLLFDGANTKYITSSFGGQIYMDGSGNISIATSPSGTAGNTVTPTVRLTVSESGVSVKAPGFITSIPNDGSGFKHKRFGASCLTLIGAGNNCQTTYSWTTAFADANYTVLCTGQGPSGIPVLTLNTHIAASVTINIQSVTSAQASFTEVDCIGVHD